MYSETLIFGLRKLHQNGTPAVVYPMNELLDIVW
jgi:hypothetical protein